MPQLRQFHFKVDLYVELSVHTTIKLNPYIKLSVHTTIKLNLYMELSVYTTIQLNPYIELSTTWPFRLCLAENLYVQQSVRTYFSGCCCCFSNNNNQGDEGDEGSAPPAGTRPAGKPECGPNIAAEGETGDWSIVTGTGYSLLVRQCICWLVAKSLILRLAESSEGDSSK